MNNLNPSRILPVWLFALALLLATAAHALAGVHYVNINSTNATPPYTNWATAARNIQDAVDAAVAGDEVVVTNGIYATGGRAVYGTLMNRVAVNKPLTLRSVNGPHFTVIQGYQVPGTAVGDGAIRCVYLTNGASLSGFTLTNGATRNVYKFPTNRQSSGGGLWCESTNAAVVSNCVLVGNAAIYGGGAGGGTLKNCKLSSNRAFSGSGVSTNGTAYYYDGIGGGAYSSTLNNCALSGNSAPGGGGALYCDLNNCMVSSNSASYGYGGDGTLYCTLNNCTLTGNSGSGGYYSTLNNCTLTASGIGADSSTLNNCTLTGNAVGAYGSTLNNCTLTGNSVGANYSTLNNCIAYFNTAPLGTTHNYDSSSTLNYCCTTPLPNSGVGNISLDPQLATFSHLSPASPCHGAGNMAYASGTDIDGEAWGNPPSIGCDEYRAGAVTGALSVAISASFTNVAVGFAVQFTALIEGRTTASVWDFGDGGTVTNQPYISHAWAAPGDYAVVLRADNETLPTGISATVTVHVVEGVHYVAVNSTNPVAPYSSWATAAANIQDAVDAATADGAVVLVTNGIYDTGGRAVGTNLLANRVAVDKPLRLRSVNGPQFTIILGRRLPGTNNGEGAIRCVYLTNGASLSGFMLTNGATRAVADYPTFRESSGGGLWCESTNAVVVSNCVVAGNSAYYYAGGAYQGTLNNCTIVGNNSPYAGGGSYGGTLNNCTLTGNSAGSGGGASESTLNNCALASNSATLGGGANHCTLNNCMLTSNTAVGDNYYHYGGGGAYECTLNNCALTGNATPQLGGGAFDSMANNCTLTGNSALDGGGAYFGTLNNCIVCFNTGGNYAACTLSYCCTTPQPTSGIGNISLDPQLASASHLSEGSPCSAAGNAAYATGTDIDGEPWANPPSIGCDEYHAGAVTGLLSVAISANYTYLGPGVQVDFIGQIGGRASVSRWEFDDGTVLSNRPYASHSWTNTGDHIVVLRAYNESNPGGASATLIIHVLDHPTHYVAMASTNPVAPYTSWATAASNIQDAVDAAATGAEIVVTNGLYATGGRALYGTMTNRVTVDKPLTLRSVNGPQFTTIQGKKAPGGGDGYGNGEGAIRCVYLTNGASLSGFTLTNGATLFAYVDPQYRTTSGGGLWCESTNAVVVSNCVVAGNQAYAPGGGVYQGTLNNSTLSHNSGHGASSSTLNNCTLTGNSESGAYHSTLNNCTVTTNFYGALESTLNNCTVSGNSYVGAYYGTLNNCTVSRNPYGAQYSTLNNCALTGNSGWGAYSSTLVNCTVIGNSNGAAYGTLKNCIVYFNQRANYDTNSTLNYCCTTPLPTNGVGNISLDPQLASTTHLSAGSPCRGAGNTAYTTGTDMDGETWASPPSIGCDEYYAGATTGLLSVAISPSYNTYVRPGAQVDFAAEITGQTSASRWEFGDGTVLSNRPYASHRWTNVGDYTMVLRAYNESNPGGASATLTIHVLDHLTYYVAMASANPVAPYTSWATAARNIQDAVDASVAGDEIVVTNGIYATGTRAIVGDSTQNRVAVDKSLTLRSVNGPNVTVIDGGHSVRCVYLTNSASLSGFTLSNGLASYGAGVYGGTLNNCTITGSGSGGGGAYSSTLINCALTANSSAGAYNCTLTNCTVTGNSGVGAQGGTLNNCVVYFNVGGNYTSSYLNYCCTTPVPTNGAGNISADPQLASASRLSAGSPCRGAGNPAYATGTDIDGEPWASPPSIGCDEYYAGALIGPLSAAITSYTRVPIGYAVQFAALIDGRAASSAWDFGDGTTATNQPFTSHVWAALGDYTVVLRAYNDSNPGGISATVTVHVVTGVQYVAAGSTNPVAPYTSWATAATSIQDAINAAEPGGPVTVLVTNGTYSPIYVPDLITVRSVKGPQFTTINGGGYSRCASLATNATLSGFTLINGLAGGGYYSGEAYGGGATGGTLTNCTLTGNAVEAPLIYSYSVGDAYGGGAAYCTLHNCTLTGNSARAPLDYNYGYGDLTYSVGNALGGGAAFCTLNNCTLTGNLAQTVVRDAYYGPLDNNGAYGREAGGGGAYDCTLTNCSLSNNRVQGYNGYLDDPFDPFGYGYHIVVLGLGGGALDSTLNNCTLSANSGGGAYDCTLANCALIGNSGYGADSCTLRNCTLTGNFSGAVYSTLNNCTLTGNSSYGADSCTLRNCTLTGNSSGAVYSTLSNCIAYFNGGANYDSSSTLSYCCTTPQPTNGVGNIASDPQLASASHLSFLSPCIGKGNAGAASGVDIDGEPWVNPPSIGCDEIHAGATTGPLNVSIKASFTNVIVSYPVAFTGMIEGRADLSVWSFGDGAVEINQPYVTHSWSATGDYVVSVWAFNDSFPDGISATQTVHVVTGVHYVAANSTSPVAPYTSWATAATNIQDAINAAEPGSAQLVVSNGTYGPISIPALMTVRSVNGAEFTTINGAHSNLCASLANSVRLSGFTLTNGAGGASGGTLNNCILIDNSAAGASGCTLNNCALTGNYRGASSCTLNHCTLTGNPGGGASSSTLSNCIVYFNGAANYDSSCTLNYCCTSPQFTNGVGNISSNPQLASASRLSAGSPCRGAGNAAYASGTDIDGEAWANPPSMGCDELHPAALTGPLSMDIAASYTSVTVGFVVNLTGLIDGKCAASSWDFGDGITATNQPYTSHSWAAAGDYPVVLRAYNESQPAGISATLTVHVGAGVHYVALGSLNPTAPYTSWETAATNIQDAVDAAIEPGAQVLVTNGIYTTGGRAVDGTNSNRVVTRALLTVRSVNGPQFTTIDGSHSVRCVYLNDRATLSGFTLSNGLASYGYYAYGGGVFCESAAAVVSNCVIAGNSSSGLPGKGGGAYGGTLNNCTLTGNYASYYGGGSAYCAMSNCTVSGNSASEGGGAYGATLTNCTLSGNSASYGGAADGGMLNHCTLTGNSASVNGGGVYYSTLNGCTLSSNRAPSTYPNGNGGGAYNSTLNNCTLIGNSSGYTGGGAYYGTLNNCTLTGNSAPGGVGGGAFFVTLNNCILTGNWAATYGGGAGQSSLNNCVLSGNLVVYGVYGESPDAWNSSLNNCRFANPLFMDAASGNLRLQSNSPCINAGNNAYVSGDTDLDGLPRIVGGSVDIGAYESQPYVGGGFVGWLQQYGLATDGTADYADPDGDRMNNWQEWVAGTVPTDATSALRLLAPVFSPPGVLLRWSSDTNHAYFVERTTTLKPPLTFSRLRNTVPGLSGTTTFTDTAPPATGAAFYRVGTASTNSPSPLWLQPPIFVPASVVVSWTSVTNRRYFLERATNLAAPMLFTPLATNLVGHPGTTTYTDTNTLGAGPCFYRVGVSTP